MSTETDNKHRPEWHWGGRSLTNYKKMHASTAEEKGVGSKFAAAATLTEAKKILFGYKRKQTR